MKITYTHNGHTDTLPKWAERSGLRYTTLFFRLKRGWDFSKAISEPPQEQTAPCHITGTKKCSRCGLSKPVSEFIRLKRRSGNEYAPACRQCDRIRTRNARTSLRIEIIRHYSHGLMQCATCGEGRLPVLDIDHIAGGGISHRKQFKTPHAYYLHLRTTLPNGLRVLCRNCNWLAWLDRKNRSLK